MASTPPPQGIGTIYGEFRAPLSLQFKLFMVGVLFFILLVFGGTIAAAGVQNLHDSGAGIILGLSLLFSLGLTLPLFRLNTYIAVGSEGIYIQCTRFFKTTLDYANIESFQEGPTTGIA